MPIFNDILEAMDEGEVLAEFEGNYYNGLPALAAKRTGLGRLTIWGQVSVWKLQRFF